MSPPQEVVQIIPTYISTDLVTPGRNGRETLPAIATRSRGKNEWKLWGQETKISKLNGDELAYHHFKPSYLMHRGKENVVVTHRHYGNRTWNVVAKDQPYVLTSLLLSKCRLNDERMPTPFKSNKIHQFYIGEPYPKEFYNSYSSHRCKFQVFPTSGTDIIDAETTSIRRKTAAPCIQDTTKEALKELMKKYYGTSTYNSLHEQPIQLYNNKDKNLKKRKSTMHGHVGKTNICMKCGHQIKICVAPSQNKTPTQKNNTPSKIVNDKKLLQKIPNMDQEDDTKREANSNENSAQKSANLYDYNTRNLNMEERCTTGSITDEDDQSMSSNLTKKDIRKRLIMAGEDMKKIMNWDPREMKDVYAKLSEVYYCQCKNNSDSEDDKDVSDEDHVIEEIYRNDITINEQDKQIHPQNQTEKQKRRKHQSHQNNKGRLALIPPLVEAPTQQSKQPRQHQQPIKQQERFERGFKTEARHRYLKKYAEHIPNLRDAVTEGRKHNFCGYNVHVFRG